MPHHGSPVRTSLISLNRSHFANDSQSFFQNGVIKKDPWPLSLTDCHPAIHFAEPRLSPLC
ncbi:MAG: hypothetical protein EBW14_17325 [Oxalobacteraceae bacterium]|nr:hypothetical protein [Oxalobacteraceae bacterium]